MTINIFVSGDKLFDWTGNAEDAEELDKALREVAHNHGVARRDRAAACVRQLAFLRRRRQARSRYRARHARLALP